VIFHLDGQPLFPLFLWYLLGYGSALEHARPFQPKVIVKPPRLAFLDHEAPRAGAIGYGLIVVHRSPMPPPELPPRA
jgi:hypothetical protein